MSCWGRAVGCEYTVCGEEENEGLDPQGRWQSQNTQRHQKSKNAIRCQPAQQNTMIRLGVVCGGMLLVVAE